MGNLSTYEVFGGKHVHKEIVCKGCKYAHGEPPWADRPTKGYCKVYRRVDGLQKPDDVYYDGTPCEFREPE